VDLLAHRPPGEAGLKKLKLKGPMLKKTCWSIVSEQMAPYVNAHMPAFGAVATGTQWVAFLARERPAVMSLDDSHAVVFGSLDAIERDFARFFEIFGRPAGPRSRTLLGLLEPEHRLGVVQPNYAQRVVERGEERSLSFQDRAHFYEDLHKAMDVAFRAALDAPDALEHCFVESRASRAAESRLERLAQELSGQLAPASDQYPPRVSAQIGQEPVGRPGGGYLARLLGEPSSGKSVFLRRFYNTRLGPLRERIVLVWIDGEKLGTRVEEDASREALHQVKEELFDRSGMSWNHFREVYRRDWNERLELSGLKEDDTEAARDVRAVRMDFVKEMQAREESRPRKALLRYLEFAVRYRGRLPCVVLDNVDKRSLEHLREAIAWAIGVHASAFALTTIAMTDTALWRLRAQRHDQAGDHMPDHSWLHRPKVREVLEKRTEYLRSVLGDAQAGTTKTHTRVGRAGQFQWTVEADSLVRTVQAVLLEDEERTHWIGALCNYDLREILDLCRRIVLSPHVKAEQLLSAQVTHRPIHRWAVLKAIIAPKKEQFQGASDDLVMNVFGFWDHRDQQWAPLLPARALAVLRRRAEDDKTHNESFPGFVVVEEFVHALEGLLGPRAELVRDMLERLRVAGLVEPYDPSVVDLHADGARVRITPRGLLHLEWALKERTYVRLMAEVDPITVPEVRRELRRAWDRFIEGITAKRSDKRQVRAAEDDFVRGYVRYVLEQAESVAPRTQGGAHSQMAPIAEFEAELRRQWRL